jgi:hypothetical protein
MDLTEVLPPPPAWLLGVGPSAVWVTSDAVSRVAAPPSVGARVTLSRAVGHFSFSGGVGYRTGSGTLDGLGEGVPFRTHTIEPGVNASWTPAHRLGVALGLEASWWLVARDAATRDFRSVQTAGGPSVSARVGWERRFGLSLAVGVHARGGVVALPVERSLSASPLLGLDAFVSFVLP